MDDPWGSPWADEIQTPHPVKLKEDDFAVKPTTPIKGASLAPEQKTSSPWDDADDDGFGEWAAGSAEEEVGFGLDGTNDDWKSNTGNGTGPGLTPTGSHALSTSWNNDLTTPQSDTPTLAPSLLPKPPDILRQPSPDPWALNAHEGEKHAEAAPVLTEQHGHGENTDESTKFGTVDSQDIAADPAPLTTADMVMPEWIGIENGTFMEREAVREVSSPSNTESIETTKPADVSGAHGDVPEAGHVSSRPSSSPSELSRPDETTQESPRTSLDEEPKRPSMTRKVSTKVQELVEHFDGLAKQEGVAAPLVGRSGSPDPKMEDVPEVEEEPQIKEEVEEMDDFGDFEDVQSETEETMDGLGADSAGKSPVDEGSNADIHVPEAVHQEAPVPIARKDLGPVEFTIDTLALDRLYSGIEAETPSEKLFIPDVVPHDSFSSTQERKTWYRISRYGTMRKHNTGNDENYVRVNWTQSQVRVETLKIVARWIEEDRISGRVVLGGASKGSSIFGWNDSKAAPVPLAAAFAVKNGKQKVIPAAPAVEIPREWPKGLVKTQSVSRASSLSKTRRKSSIKTVASEETKPEAKLPVANFGWNSDPQGVQDSKPQLPAHGKQLSISNSGTPLASAKISLPSQTDTSRTSSPLAEPTKRAIPATEIPPRPHSIAHISISALPALTTSNILSDDDDWGELVSSPSTNIRPAILPPSGSLHKSTGSLSSAFPLAVPIPTTSVHLQEVKPEQSSGGWASEWMSGSNEVSTSKIMQSVATKTPNTSSHNGFTPANTSYMDIAFSPSTRISHQTVTAPSADPWASADFSFFESSAVPVSKSMAASTPKLPPPKTVTFSTPAVLSASSRNQKSKEEVEQDRIVQSVVKGLPDLSYMLRR